ncbi:MAG: hypothetical protein AAF430_13130 [Myxococcota bacterium]
MRRTLVRGALGLVVALLGFAGFTLWALESGAVVVVETRDGEGATRETRVWFVERDDGLWIEAGTPENPWFVDVLREPSLTLRGDKVAGRYRALPQPNPEGHRRIRAWLREKYGIRDAWVAFVFDTERSIAVRLEPLPGADAPPS